MSVSSTWHMPVLMFSSPFYPPDDFEVHGTPCESLSSVSQKILTNFLMACTASLQMAVNLKRQLFMNVQSSDVEIKVCQFNLLNSIILLLWRKGTERVSCKKQKSATKRETILIKLTNQTSDQVNIVTVRFISSALSFPISRLFAFLLASSVYIDFISISRSNRRFGLQARLKKGENIKCYSCFTLTTSPKHIVARNEDGKVNERGEQKPEATSICCYLWPFTRHPK